MTYEDLEENLHDAQEWTHLKDSNASKLSRLFSRINLQDDYASNLLMNPKSDRDRGQLSDRANRAVAEQVLDPRIRMILLKLINQNVIYQVNGCVSTGKEANVYHALTDAQQHRAIKIYKSTILTFKNRDQYVTGEYRFRHGYSKSNPRKMVQVWAEKEMRNLKRLQAAGIPCPEPLVLKLQVLVMSFIGDEQGWPAPRLKDASVLEAELPDLYRQCLVLLRRLYQECRLVHADFSEYNLLYRLGRIIVIDVSQSVEVEHPHALEFLRADCMNILKFFRVRGVATLSLKALFDYVIDKAVVDHLTFLERVILASTLKCEEEEEEIAIFQEQNGANAPVNKGSSLSQSFKSQDFKSKSQADAFTLPYRAGRDQFLRNDEEIFKNSFIPRHLQDVYDVERDVQMVQSGRAEELIYKNIAQLSLDKVSDSDASGDSEDGSSAEEDKEEGNDDDDDDDDDDDLLSNDGTSSRLKNMTPEERKAWRRANKTTVKAANRERRQHKLKKHIKKKKTSKNKK